MKKKRYSADQRAAALALLRDNGCNYTSASVSLHVPVSTLHSWVTRYNMPAKNDDAAMMTVEEAQSHFIARTASIAESLAVTVIERAAVLARDETDLTKINGTINAITRYAEYLRASSDAQPSPAPGTHASMLSLIHQTIINCNKEHTD